MEKEREEEQARIDAAEDLTEEEKAELATLKGQVRYLKTYTVNLLRAKLKCYQINLQGFNDWSRKDFNAFIKANEKYGRNNIEAIAKDVEGKTLEQVRTYAAVFWLRGPEDIAGKYWSRVFK